MPLLKPKGRVRIITHAVSFPESPLLPRGHGPLRPATRRQLDAEWVLQVQLSPQQHEGPNAHAVVATIQHLPSMWSFIRSPRSSLHWKWWCLLESDERPGKAEASRLPACRQNKPQSTARNIHTLQSRGGQGWSGVYMFCVVQRCCTASTLARTRKSPWFP